MKVHHFNDSPFILTIFVRLCTTVTQIRLQMFSMFMHNRKLFYLFPANDHSSLYDLRFFLMYKHPFICSRSQMHVCDFSCGCSTLSSPPSWKEGPPPWSGRPETLSPTAMQCHKVYICLKYFGQTSSTTSALPFTIFLTTSGTKSWGQVYSASSPLFASLGMLVRFRSPTDHSFHL